MADVIPIRQDVIEKIVGVLVNEAPNFGKLQFTFQDGKLVLVEKSETFRP